MNEHTEHIQAVKGVQPRVGRPKYLIKEANTCANCMFRFNINAGQRYQPLTPKLACNMHNVEIQAGEWCKYHKKRK